jgi:hypothetical protein
MRITPNTFTSEAARVGFDCSSSLDVEQAHSRVEANVKLEAKAMPSGGFEETCFRLAETFEVRCLPYGHYEYPEPTP